MKRKVKNQLESTFPSANGRLCIQCNLWQIEENFNKSRRECKDCSRERKLQARYGLSMDTYQKMLQDQSYRCALCDQEYVGYLHVDHSHKTGKIRALLCSNCNTLIGLAKEKVSTLARAILYLEEHE